MPIACIGHWYVSLLYIVPVALVVAGLKVSNVRARRRGDVDEPGLDTADFEALEAEFDTSATADEQLTAR